MFVKTTPISCEMNTPFERKIRGKVGIIEIIKMLPKQVRASGSTRPDPRSNNNGKPCRISRVLNWSPK